MFANWLCKLLLLTGTEVTLRQRFFSSSSSSTTTTTTTHPGYCTKILKDPDPYRVYLLKNSMMMGVAL